MNRANIKQRGILKVEVMLPNGSVQSFENVVVERWPEFPNWVDIRDGQRKDEDGHYLLLAMVPQGSVIRCEREAVPAREPLGIGAAAPECRHGCYGGGCGAPGCSCNAECPCQQHTAAPDLRHD